MHGEESQAPGDLRQARMLYNHFNQPGHDRCLTMKVRIIEKIYHHTNSPILSTPYRTDRELFWIKELGNHEEVQIELI
jgi:hypothetical protein